MQPRPIGTTYGLTHPHGEGKPEQVYVFDNADHDDRRPIRVEGWNGYRVDAVMALTRNQARELVAVLTEALAEPDPPGVTTYRLPNPTIDDVCPLIPDGASDWERESITRVWRDVHRAANAAAEQAVRALDRPADRHGGSALPGAAANLQAAQRELSAHVDHVIHRHALAENDAEVSRG